MKLILALTTTILLTQACATGPSYFDLSPSQSMSITGKGPGQDAAINPYSGLDCMAIVKNLGPNNFSIRVQADDSIIATILILPGEEKEVLLHNGYELYLDSDLESKARVKFRKA